MVLAVLPMVELVEVAEGVHDGLEVAYGERVRRATTSYLQLQSLQTPPLHNGKGASFNLSCF